MVPVRIYVGRNVDAELRPDGMIWLKQKDGPVIVIDHGSVRLLWSAVEAWRKRNDQD
jgi:hypothetical protein